MTYSEDASYLSDKFHQPTLKEETFTEVIRINNFFRIEGHQLFQGNKHTLK